MDLKIATTTDSVPQAQGKASSGHDQRKKRVSQDGVVGLVNIGNSCYMNAALQALSNSPPFRQYFLECHSTSGQYSNRLCDAIASLFQRMWAPDHLSGNLSPRQVSSAMKNPMFRGTQQQDAQEFLRSLLTQLHDETSYVAPPMAPSRNSMTSSASQDSGGPYDPAHQVAHGEGEESPHLQRKTERDSQGSSGKTERDSQGSSGKTERDSQGSSGKTERDSQGSSSGKTERDSQGSSGKTERDSQGSSGKTERDSQGSSGKTERDSQGSSGKQTLDFGCIYVLDLELRRVVSVHKMATDPASVVTDAQCKDLLVRETSPGDLQLKDVSSNTIVVSVPLGVCSSCTHAEARPESTTPTTQLTTPNTQGTTPPLQSAVSSSSSSQGPSECATDSAVCMSNGSAVNTKGTESTNGITDCNTSPHSIPDSSNSPSSTPEVKSKLSHARSSHSQDSSLCGRNQHREQRVIRSIVTEIFEGTLVSKVKCSNCKKASVTQELFQDLALPIPGRKEMSKFAEKGVQQKEIGSTRTNGIGKKVYDAINFVLDLTKDSLVDPHTSLDDCLNAYFGSCELKGDNKYFCTHCDSFQTSVKKMRITRLPEILCIHLKRFRFDTYLSKKIGRHITYPLVDLNLHPYLHKDCQGVGNYELMAVITHDGGVSGGHYIALAKNTVRNQWFEYNDAHVTPVSASTVTSAEGYVLFYRKIRESKPRCHSVDIGSTAMFPSTTTPSFYVSRHWLLLLKHHTDPGPIFCEHTCEHGAILPSRRIEEVSTKVVSVAKETWEELLRRYGGGPALRSLEVCAVCLDHLKCLNERREKEKMDVYQMQAKAHTAGLPKQEPCLVANSWLQQWQNFIQCKTLDVLLPGAIDNSKLLKDRDGTFEYSGHPYRKLSHAVWTYFLQLYGGGPTLMTCPPTNCHQ